MADELPRRKKTYTLPVKSWLHQVGQGFWIGSEFMDHGNIMRVSKVGAERREGRERLIDVEAEEVEAEADRTARKRRERRELRQLEENMRNLLRLNAGFPVICPTCRRPVYRCLTMDRQIAVRNEDGTRHDCPRQQAEKGEKS